MIQDAQVEVICDYEGCYESVFIPSDGSTVVIMIPLGTMIQRNHLSKRG